MYFDINIDQDVAPLIYEVAAKLGREAGAAGSSILGSNPKYVAFLGTFINTVIKSTSFSLLNRHASRPCFLHKCVIVNHRRLSEGTPMIYNDAWLPG